MTKAVSFLYDFSHRLWAIRRKYLLKIRQDAIARHTAIAKDGVIGFLLGNRFDSVVGQGIVETGDEVAIGDRKNALAVDRRRFDLRRKQNAHVEHDLDEQVFVRAVGLDVADLQLQFALFEFARVIIDVAHIRRVDAEDAKAYVEVVARIRSVCRICHIGEI
mgnify:CR=1 FL=1